MYISDMKNHAGFLYEGIGENKKQFGAFIGINSPLFQYVSLLIKMNVKNLKRKNKK